MRLTSATAVLLAPWASLGGVEAGIAGEDLGWELLVTSAGAAVPRTCFKAPGLPAWAGGAFFVGGPALFEMGGYSFQSHFDGFGRYNRFEMREGEVCYTSAWLDTGTWREAHELGAPLRGVVFEDTTPARPECPVLQPMCQLAAPSDNNWVNMIEVGGEALLLSDTHTMVRMDLETMSCSGVKPWADDEELGRGMPMRQPDWVSSMHMALAGSAHPLKRPGGHTVVDVLTEAPFVADVEHSFIDVYTFEDATNSPQARKRLASIRADANQYFHSFGVTPSYVVLPFNLRMEMPALTGTPTLLGHFQPSWKGIHLVDGDGGVRVFDAEPFYHTHVVNAFENETGVTIDLGAYQANPFVKGPALDIALFLNKTVRDSQQNRAHVRRLHLHLAGDLQGKTTAEDFVASPGRSVDFFKVNMARSGLPYCIYYAVEWWHDDAAYASMAVLKHDLCKGTKTYWAKADTYPGEPFFVAGESGEEDDGVVVFVALDGRKRTSMFVVLDARSFEEVSAVGLPVHIPFTAHGQFIPSAPKEHRVFV